MASEFIGASELLGLAEVSALERLDGDGAVVVSVVLVDGLVLGAVPVPELVSAPGRALVFGPVAGLVVLMLGLVLELLGVLVVSLLLGGVVAPGVRVVVVDCVVVELELSVVDCAYTYPAITANAEALPIITDRNRFI